MDCFLTTWRITPIPCPNPPPPRDQTVLLKTTNTPCFVVVLNKRCYTQTCRETSHPRDYLPQPVVTVTNIETGEPALSHCREAFGAGAHVVTTNKGPVALAWRELSELAASQGLQFRFEGTVMSGTPVLSTATEALAGCEFVRIRGILNGTTNYILSEMEQGRPYAEALATAQELGYAEADPTADVEGFDVLAKVVILANVVMRAELGVEGVSREGITGLDAEAEIGRAHV